METIHIHNTAKQNSRTDKQGRGLVSSEAAPDPGLLKDALIDALAKAQVFADALASLREILGRCEEVSSLAGPGGVSEEVLLNLLDAMPGTAWLMTCFLDPITSSLHWPDFQRFLRKAGGKNRSGK